MNPAIPAAAFAAFALVVIAFQVGLAAGRPWGHLAMGGKFPGQFPPRMRVAALVQAALLLLLAGIVLARSGAAFGAWHGFARTAVWFVVAFSAVALVLNIATPSRAERRLWAPVTLGMVVASLLVALS